MSLKLSYSTWLSFKRQELEEQYHKLHPYDEESKISLTTKKSMFFRKHYNEYLENPDQDL